MRVVIVDDSAVQRRFARAAIEADGGMTVVGEARNGRDAVALVERLQPAAVLMDLHLPLMNGIEAIERIMATRPTPILVYSAFVDGDDRENATAALAAGAVDVMPKPGADLSGRLDEFAEALRRRVRVAGRAKVITHPRGRLGGTAVAVTTRRLGSPEAEPVAPAAMPPPSPELVAPRRVRVIAIGASTGGPQALAHVLGQLPADFDAAVVVVQHMADGFIEGLAAWLDGMCALPVRVAVSGRRIEPGTVSVAPSGRNLIVHESLRVTTHEPAKTQFHVPGIDETLSSVADGFGSRAVGVLLTGMGRDGAAGLKRMRDRGALTITQDEATCAVYGMPAAAMALGAAELQLPIEDLGPVLRHVVAPLRESQP
jgi:two-component system chemotaxis response regulator CheB